MSFIKHKKHKNDSFTLIDAFNQFWNVLQENGNRRSLLSAYQMYGYLCHLWNGQGRPDSFRRQNNSICAEIGVSKPTLERQREILKNSGLIDFVSNGKGDSNITYAILDVSSSKNILLLEEKKEKNFTSPVTSPVTSGVTSPVTSQPLEPLPGVHLKPPTEYRIQSTELFIIVSGEEKKFSYLKNLFEQDVGLKMKWQQNGFPAEKFFEGIEEWMNQNFKKEYLDFNEMRKHFLFWIPNYNIKKRKNGNSKNTSTIGKEMEFDHI